VEGERVALLAVSRVGLELGTVRHHHLDEVIVGMEIFGLLHGETSASAEQARVRAHPGEIERLFTQKTAPGQAVSALPGSMLSLWAASGGREGAPQAYVLQFAEKGDDPSLRQNEGDAERVGSHPTREQQGNAGDGP